MTTYKQILAHLKALGTEELVTIYNDYASMNGYENVLDNDSDFIDSQYNSPYDAIRAAFYGDYNPSHEYVTFNGYGNLLSFCYIDDEHSPLDYGDLAQWINSEGNYHQYDINVITKDNKIDAIIDNDNTLNDLLDHFNIEL